MKEWGSVSKDEKKFDKLGIWAKSWKSMPKAEKGAESMLYFWGSVFILFIWIRLKSLKVAFVVLKSENV